MATELRRLVVMSDVELGAGGPTDDFPDDAWLAALIRERLACDDLPVDLVFNGDTFDLLKTSFEGGWVRHVDARVALGKLARIEAAHPLFFQVLGEQLRSGRCERVVFLVGNHDFELVFPEVRQRIRELIGQGERVLFPGQAWRTGDVHIEHGHQTDVLFATDPDQDFVEVDGRPVLRLPWGAVAVIDVTLPLEPTLYPFDRLRPRGRALELLPEAKELLLSTFWRYWTREYLPRAWRRTDPLTRLSWPMLKEIAYRFGTVSTGVSTGEHWHKALRESGEVRLVILGHEHRPEWWTWSDRKLLRLGCIRDEYRLARDGSIGPRLPKVWAEVTLRDGRAVQSGLVEREASQGPPWPMPASIYDLRSAVHEQLLKLPGGRGARIARQAHEQAEGPAAPSSTATASHPAESLRRAVQDRAERPASTRPEERG